MPRTTATTRTEATTRTLATTRNLASQLRIPIDFLDMGITHFMSWRGGFSGKNPTHIDEEIQNIGFEYRGTSAISSVYLVNKYYSDIESANSDYFRTPDSIKIASAPMTAFTLGVWVKLEANTAGSQIVSQYRQTGTQRSWSLRYLGTSGANKLGMFLSQTGGTEFRQDTNLDHISDLAWHFVVFTYTTAGVQFYVDGSAVNSSVGTGTLPTQINNPTQEIDIGKLTTAGGGNSSFWDGRIGIWFLSTTTALSQDNITYLYNITNNWGEYR